MRRESLTTIPGHYIIPRWTMKATYKVGGMETRWRDKNDIATKEVTLLTIWSIRAKFNKIVQDGRDSLDDINKIDAVLNGLLEEQSRRKKTSVELNTNINDDIPSSQQENISQQRPSKKKRNMPQHLLVSDPVVSMKTKGRPKRTIKVKPGLEVSLDLKKKMLVVIVEKKVITSLDVKRKSLMRKKRAIKRGEAEKLYASCDVNDLFVFDDIVQIFLWIIDSGCSKHMTGNRSILTNFVEKFLGTVRFGNNDFSVISGYGDVVIGLMTVKKVYYVEGLLITACEPDDVQQVFEMECVLTRFLIDLLALDSISAFWF
ncbi:hypothetical protein Tco_0751874 [Tanacetum coccineum]|uniref:Retrovirus-related Pol polyprotein from transposon TNT 1-94-like beta-barrel domain-containing protein n=1 Tax=Tanacetum coccineum TaxID=301880 RepID=A0ABQ4Z597_9ASTR